MNQNVIQIDYDKDVNFFDKDLIDITLKTGQTVKESKKHDPILEIAVPNTKGSLLFVIFLNLYLMVGIGQV